MMGIGVVHGTTPLLMRFPPLADWKLDRTSCLFGNLSSQIPRSINSGDLWQFSQDAAIVDRDENSGIFYTTIGTYVVAIGTDSRLLWNNSTANRRSRVPGLPGILPGIQWNCLPTDTGGLQRLPTNIDIPGQISQPRVGVLESYSGQSIFNSRQEGTIPNPLSPYVSLQRTESQPRSHRYMAIPRSAP